MNSLNAVMTAALISVIKVLRASPLFSALSSSVKSGSQQGSEQIDAGFQG